MKIKFLFYLFIINLLSLGFWCHSKEVNKIIAKIDNELITSYDIKNKILTTLILANKEINQENINILKKKSLEDLILNRLKRIELKNHNFVTDNQRINSYLNAISSNNISSLKLKFDKNNVNYQEFVNEIDLEFKWRNLIYKYYSKKIEIDQEDIGEEVEKMIKKKVNLIKYDLSEIEILMNNDNSDDGRILQIQNEIKNTSFEDAVLRFSISSTSSNKGKLGWVNAGSLSNEFLNILNEMEIGDVSKPIKKQDKIIFIKLNDKKASFQTYEDKETIKKELIEQKKNELFVLYSSSFLSKLRNTKYIEYYK